MKMKARAILLSLIGISLIVPAEDMTVDFGFKPPQWRTAICPPDDPYKSLVSERGSIFYHFNQARRSEFGTEVFVVVDDAAVITGQALLSPRIPIVQTRRRAGDVNIFEEAFAVPRVPGPSVFKGGFTVERKDRLRFNRDWAALPAGASPELATAAVDDRKPVLYQIKTPAGASLVTPRPRPRFFRPRDARGAASGWRARGPRAWPARGGRRCRPGRRTRRRRRGGPRAPRWRA